MRQKLPQAGRALLKARAPEGNVAGGHTRHSMMDDARSEECGKTAQMVELFFRLQWSKMRQDVRQNGKQKDYSLMKCLMKSISRNKLFFQ